MCGFLQVDIIKNGAGKKARRVYYLTRREPPTRPKTANEQQASTHKYINKEAKDLPKTEQTKDIKIVVPFHCFIYN